MGVNRIVMQNGVVWWLPPLRARNDAERPRSPRRPRRDGSRRGSPRDASSPPPPGFVPLSSLGIPGLDSILFSHADFYRDAYDRAVRDRLAGENAPPPAGPPGPDPLPGPDGAPGANGDAGGSQW